MDRLGAVYAAFHARDIDGVPVAMAPEVDRPNAREGGRVVGHEAVRGCWMRQWAQVVRALDGTLLREATVRHVYTFRDGLVARMDVEA